MLRNESQGVTCTDLESVILRIFIPLATREPTVIIQLLFYAAHRLAKLKDAREAVRLYELVLKSKFVFCDCFSSISALPSLVTINIELAAALLASSEHHKCGSKCLETLGKVLERSYIGPVVSALRAYALAHETRYDDALEAVNDALLQMRHTLVSREKEHILPENLLKGKLYALKAYILLSRGWKQDSISAIRLGIAFIPGDPCWEYPCKKLNLDFPQQSKLIHNLAKFCKVCSESRNLLQCLALERSMLFDYIPWEAVLNACHLPPTLTLQDHEHVGDPVFFSPW
ncbi:unnamed protein product [Darwinula stevensoni]|uniref:Uncharacterized protein n=1 Tax=Darwinula stevensoni TaxID=69355 RepID=A0A7R9AEK7_9CRUS|nr:unnamed protein product [Darwinula stevensoni]CAG0902045.1 unnamed protein product [Darwinula stevensoni]